MTDTKPQKPFYIEDRKPVTEIDVAQWKLTLVEWLRVSKEFKPYLEEGATWGTSRQANRGFTE